MAKKKAPKVVEKPQNIEVKPTKVELAPFPYAAAVNSATGLFVRKDPTPDAQVTDILNNKTKIVISEECNGYGRMATGWVKLDFIAHL